MFLIIRVLDFFFKNCWYIFFFNCWPISTAILIYFEVFFWSFWRFVAYCWQITFLKIFFSCWQITLLICLGICWSIFFFYKLLVDYLMCSVLMRNWVCTIHFLPRMKKELLLLSVLYIFLGQCLCVKVGLEIARYALLWNCKSCSVMVSQRKEFWFNCYCFFEWIGVSNGRGRGG